MPCGGGQQHRSRILLVEAVSVLALELAVGVPGSARSWNSIPALVVSIHTRVAFYTSKPCSEYIQEVRLKQDLLHMEARVAIYVLSPLYNGTICVPQNPTFSLIN